MDNEGLRLIGNKDQSFSKSMGLIPVKLDTLFR